MSSSKEPGIRAILGAWLIAGVLDISSFFVILLTKGTPITRGLQGIAIGLLGRDAALQGGTGTALLGFALHFLIMLAWVLIFFAISRLFPVIARHPLVSGIVYGPIVYLIMYWLVIPLSRIGPRPHSLSNDGLAIAIHLCLIGLPIALILSRYTSGGVEGGGPAMPRKTVSQELDPPRQR